MIRERGMSQHRFRRKIRLEVQGRRALQRLWPHCRIRL
jgi:hypothetical protein